MADIIKEVLRSGKKPAEKVALLAKKAMEDKKLLARIMELLRTGSEVEKGTAADILKHVSEEQPDMFGPYIDSLIGYIDYDAPRVKWGVPETVGHLAKKFPEQTARAVPKLLQNAKDESTVIRWCAAFALSEIARYCLPSRKKLVPKFQAIVKSEKNNGVKNVYLKALDKISKE